MVYLEIRERIGNQLFQYAFARKMAEKYADGLAINFDAVEERDLADQGWVNALVDFAVQPFEYYQRSQYAIYQKIILNIIRYNLSKLDHVAANRYLSRIESIINKFGIFFLYDGFYEFKEPFMFVKDKILIGYFQSPQYFSDIDDIIKKEFVPIHKRIPDNALLYELIHSTESVCVSIRRGDFLSEGEIDSVYICDEKYFSDAVEKISEIVLNPVFFVFSDDIVWVKENMTFPQTTYYESGNDPAWEKLRLMSCCKHFIISNSTFSWWAQHLSQYPQKKVIAPQRWRKDGRKVDIYEENWINIDVNR